MMDDHLRHLLEQIDPMPARVRVDTNDSPRARTLLEHIMRTSPADNAVTTRDEDPRPVQVRTHRRRTTLLVGGLAAVTLGAVAVGVLVSQEDGGSSSRQTLSIAVAGTTISSCLPFDTEILAEMPVAFSGTVTEISSSAMTVEVDRWYRAATETDLVDVTLPPGTTSAALDGVDFEAGQRYLLTATDGVVNGCGFSGPATPDLEAAFKTAFGG